MTYHDFFFFFMLYLKIYFLGSPYPNYATYSATPSLSPTSNAASPGYAAVQPIPYMPSFTTIYGKISKDLII